MKKSFAWMSVGLAVAVAGCTVTLVDERTRTERRDGGSPSGHDGGCPGCPPPGADADLPDGSLPPLGNGIRLVTPFSDGYPISRAIVDGSGTCAAFAWSSHELVEDRDRGRRFVYVVDLVTGELELISVDDAGDPQPDGSFEPQHSVGDGGNDFEVDAVVSDRCERVVFASDQILDESAGVTEPGWSRVYLRDRAAGTTRQLGPTHFEFGEAYSFTPSIGAAGDQIVLVAAGYYFSADSMNNQVLAVADPSGSAEWLHLFDPEMPLGSQPNATEPVMAADGQYALAKVSYFDERYGGAVLARVDLRTGALHHIAGDQPEPVTFSAYRISADGSVVAFTSDDDFGGSVPAESGTRLYLFDVEADSVEWINRDEAGGRLNIHNHAIGLSDDGRYVVYSASEGRTEDNREGGIYRYDIDTGAHRLLTTSYGGAPSDAHCEAPGISADGRTVAFFCSSYGDGLPLTTDLEGDHASGLFVWEE